MQQQASLLSMFVHVYQRKYLYSLSSSSSMADLVLQTKSTHSPSPSIKANNFMAEIYYANCLYQTTLPLRMIKSIIIAQ